MADLGGGGLRTSEGRMPFVPTDQSSPESKTARRFASLWVGGNRLKAEEFLDRLRGNGPLDQKVALRVIYEEICLRQDSGENVQSEEYADRFPQYRDELALLFECQGLLEFGEPKYPKVGELYNEFRLLSEIGRGGQGRVYLGVQTDLADRQVVLKITPQTGAEHLSLARVVHTNIVPLYFAREDGENNVRVFCMPYLGRMSLAHLLAGLHGAPPEKRHGKAIMELLETSGPTSGPRSTSERRQLETSDYVDSMCRFGAAVADGLQYVHERGLCHLDVKPSNVLITADGVPMLLDFHLTREPVPAHVPPPEWFGGTPDYMSPEQKHALDAVRARRPLEMSVDHRADIFSLGQVLYEALLGNHTEGVSGEDLVPLHLVAKGVSIGLSDVVAKCLRARPAERYQSAAALASDLRRHLGHLPLAGVPNRSLAERWRKWRKRSPGALSMMSVAVMAVVTAVASGIVAWEHFGTQYREAHNSLNVGNSLAEQKRYDEANQEFARGLRLAQATPFAGELVATLTHREEQTRERHQIDVLASLVDKLRFVYGQETIAPEVRKDLEGKCRKAWDARSSLTSVTREFPELEERVRINMLDLAVLWAHVVARSKTPSDLAQADDILTEAKHVLGAGIVLTLEHQVLEIAQLESQQKPVANARAAVVSQAMNVANTRDPKLNSWDYQAVGRCLLRLGQVGAAARCFQTAVELTPNDFWANFFQADAAWRRGELNEATAALRVCVSLAPDKAVCYYNRGLMHSARKNWDLAYKDFDKAVALDSQLGPAFLERGRVANCMGRREAALADFDRALKAGADPAETNVAMANVHLARNDRPAAMKAARQALQFNSTYAPALEIQQRINRL